MFGFGHLNQPGSSHPTFDEFNQTGLNRTGRPTLPSLLLNPIKKKIHVCMSSSQNLIFLLVYQQDKKNLHKHHLEMSLYYFLKYLNKYLNDEIKFEIKKRNIYLTQVIRKICSIRKIK